MTTGHRHPRIITDSNPSRADDRVARMYRTTDMQAGCPIKPDCRRPAEVFSTTSNQPPYKTR